MRLSRALREAKKIHAAGALADAARRYEEIAAAFPADAESLHLLAIARSQLGANEAALEAIERAIAAAPDRPAAHLDRSLILRRLGRPECALRSCDAALALLPSAAEAWTGRGNALMDLARHDEALASYDRAVALAPNSPDALNNRALALRALHRCAEALSNCDAALAMRPDHAPSWCNRAATLQDLGRISEALDACARALAIRPGHVETLINRGLLLIAMNRPAQAIESFDAALATQPEHPEALYNRGWALLLLGDLRGGWRGYGRRWRRPRAEKRLCNSFPEWRGEPLAGRTILVLEEQGAGDILQFSRYLPQLSERGARVCFLVRPALHALLRSLRGDIRLAEALAPHERFDFQCALLDLPQLFDTTLETIPSASHLGVDAARVIHWARRIGDDSFKIGICWQGDPASENDVARFAPLAYFAPLARIPGIRLISLQKQHGLEQLEGLPDGMIVETLDEFDEGPDAFLDAAAAMCSLDLVISVDSAVAHLAGALGRPIWLAQKFAPDWRWLLERDDSPWYPTMRLFRQKTAGDWSELFERMSVTLEALRSRDHRAPRIPVSIGELLDKITILQIKAERFQDHAKRRNVLSEIARLAPLAPVDETMEGLVADLRRVNEKIWDAENGLRRCERRGAFGEEFVALARSIYIENDRRSDLKRLINQQAGSSLIEEKSYPLYGDHAKR